MALFQCTPGGKCRLSDGVSFSLIQPGQTLVSERGAVVYMAPTIVVGVDASWEYSALVQNPASIG